MYHRSVVSANTRRLWIHLIQAVVDHGRAGDVIGQIAPLPQKSGLWITFCAVCVFSFSLPLFSSTTCIWSIFPSRASDMVLIGSQPRTMQCCGPNGLHLARMRYCRKAALSPLNTSHKAESGPNFQLLLWISSSQTKNVMSVLNLRSTKLSIVELGFRSGWCSPPLRLNAMLVLCISQIRDASWTGDRHGTGPLQHRSLALACQTNDLSSPLRLK